MAPQVTSLPSLKRSTAPLITIIGVSLALPVFGQELDRDIDLRPGTAAPATADPLLGAEGTDIAPAGRLTFSGTLSWLDHPLVVVGEDGGQESALVRGRLGLDLGLAISVAPWLELGLLLPLVIYQDGATEVQGHRFPSLASTGLGDVRLRAKVVFMSSAERAVGLGFVVEGFFPTAVSGGFAGDGGAGVQAMVLADWQLRGWRVAAQVGYRLRPTSELGDLLVDDELFWQVAARAPLPRDFAILLSAGGSHGTLGSEGPFGAQDENPVTAHLGVELPALGDIRAAVGGGLGLTSGYGAPRFDLFFTVRYDPHDHDDDGDRLLDHEDQCPLRAEDVDGFEDHDGCPDEDNDQDGVLDLEDSCPTIAEDADGFEDHDGCPDEDNDQDQIVDAQDECPDEAEDLDGTRDHDGCPDPDTDGDGIDDIIDQCPAQAEDVDGFQDRDGCVDADNDGDGIADSQDECPHAPEDLDGFRDSDGCAEEDNDGDGIDDVQDRCPDEAGVSETQGCPRQ